MTKENIESAIENMLKEESAQTQAVKSLIQVNPKNKNDLGSEIELKTDLNEEQVCTHTAVDMLNNFLDMEKFKRMDILSDLVTIKERKLLSKDRKSRIEIVEVAKTPDMNTFNGDIQGGAVKRFFTSRKNQVPR